MRRFAIAFVLSLLVSPALAQYPAGAENQSNLALVAPTAPVSDNSGRIATTGWVNNFFNLGIPLANGKIFIGSAGGVATAQTMSGDCTLIATGVITCTQAAGNFQVIGNLSVGGSIIDGNGILATNIVAPATPAAGTTRLYVDSTTKALTFKNDAGTVGNAVVPSTCGANLFGTSISAAGVFGCAQPSVSNISGFGTGVATALGVAIGSAGAPVLFNGAGGTPTSMVGTNITGTASGLTAGTASAVAVGGITGLGAGGATWLATPSSANLRGYITDESGTGLAYFQGGDIGTPSAGVVTNLTGTANININGTVGATTPNTVSATTIAASTSVTSPSYLGGSAVGSTATLNGTSNGSPSSAFLKLQSNGQFVSIGNTAPKANLDVNSNLSSSPALVQAGSLQRLQSADTTISGTEWVSYGALGNFLTGAVASGTSASPTAAASGLSMFNLSGWGYNGTSFQKGAIIALQSDSLWSGTNQATHIDFYTTPTTSTTLTQVGRIHPSGGLSIGNTTDPGIGTISANVKFTAAGSAGLSVTKTVRAAGGAVDCTLIFTGGILTGGTC